MADNAVSYWFSSLPPAAFNQTSYAKVFLHRWAVYNNYFCFMFPYWYTGIFLVWTTCPFLIPICSPTAGCSSHVHNSGLNLLRPRAEKSPLALQEKRAQVFAPNTPIQRLRPSLDSLSLLPALHSVHPPKTLSTFCAISLGTLWLKWKPAHAAKSWLLTSPTYHTLSTIFPGSH